MNENIFLTFYEKENDNEEQDLSNLLLINETVISDDNSLNGTSLNDELYLMYCYYELSFNIKQLLIICDYYGLKNLKKLNKLNIINSLVDFESNKQNKEIVRKRKQLWFYIEELKKDKFMKKYILL